MRGAPVLQTVYALISLISPTQESKHHWDGPQLTSDDDDEDDGYDDNNDGDDDGDGDGEDRLLHLLTFFLDPTQFLRTLITLLPVN